MGWNSVNPFTGHTSPQYHIKHNDFFETVSPSKTTNFNTPHPEWKYLARFLHSKRPPQRKEGQATATEQDNTSLQVPEEAQNKPKNTPLSGPPTQSEINQPIEEQANPRVLDPPQQQPLEEQLPSVPVIPPELPEENRPTTMTRSGQSIHPTAQYQQRLAQQE